MTLDAARGSDHDHDGPGSHLTQARSDCLHGPDNCSHQHALVTLRRDLHDKVGSTLAGLMMTVEVLERLIGVDPARAHRVLADAGTDLAELAGQVRRLSSGREEPPGRARAALDSMLARTARLLFGKLTVTPKIDAVVDTVRDDLLWVAYWIVREAMVNVIKHSDARNCVVSILVRGGYLHVRVEDDGVGIDLRSHGLDGQGLANMRWRTQAQGGWCTIDPVSPSGVAVVAILPLVTQTEER